jgi:hypothetical protein
MPARVPAPVTLAALLLVAQAAAALLPAATAAPDLGGSWVLVPQRSDDVRDGLVASLGPHYAKAELRGDAPLLWVRGWLLEQAETPRQRVLTIEQDAAEFRVGVGDDLRTYYFGRESARAGPGGGLLRATVRQDAGRVIVDERAVKGSGHVVETYELQPDGRVLLASWRLSHKGMREPLALRLTFQRARP